MSAFKIRKQIPSLIFLGVIAASPIISGCRIGNRVESGNVPDSGPSGYYSTTAKAFRVTVVQTEATHNYTGGVDLIPGIVSNYFTDPTTLLVLDSTSGKAAIYPPTSGVPGSFRGVYLDSTGTGFGVNLNSTETAWLDEACQLTSSFAIAGKIASHPDHQTIPVSSPVGTLPAKGRLGFTASYSNEFVGNCTASLSSMSGCYQSVGACPGASAGEQRQLQGIVQGIYDYYVEIGAIDPADIATTLSMGFEADYE